MGDHGAPDPSAVIDRLRIGRSLDLDDFDTRETFGWSKPAGKAALAGVLADLAELQKALFAESQRALLVILQALDAAGKGGTIRTVFTGLNPAGVTVRSFGVPTAIEASHDYLWRIHRWAPTAGRIGIFDRSHYEDVLVARVKQLVADDVWQRRFRHITEFERLLVDEGTAVVKIYLHVSPEKQRERLQDRIDSPDERWKYNAGDLDDRKLWHDFRIAYTDAIEKTSTKRAPWYVVPADRKWVRNLVVAGIVRDQLERIDPQYPDGDADLDGVTVPAI